MVRSLSLLRCILLCEYSLFIYLNYHWRVFRLLPAGAVRHKLLWTCLRTSRVNTGVHFCGVYTKEQSCHIIGAQPGIDLGVRGGESGPFPRVVIQWTQRHSLEKPFSPPLLGSTKFVINQVPYACRSVSGLPVRSIGLHGYACLSPHCLNYCNGVADGPVPPSSVLLHEGIAVLGLLNVHKNVRIGM